MKAIGRILAVAFVVAGLNAPAARAQTVGGAPAYYRLNLDTPDAALRAFLSAWRNGDFLTAYWVFSTKAQESASEHIFTFNLPGVLRNYKSRGDGVIGDLLPAVKDWEQTDPGFVFAHLMWGASRRAVLPLDPEGLPQDLSAANVPSLGRQTQTTDGQVEIAVAMKAYPEPVVFRMAKSPSGRWRIVQIVPPGGDDMVVPFGLPKN